MREVVHQFIWIDDFGSGEKVSRRSEALKALAQRGRHYYLSILPCIVQKMVSLHPAVRSQCSWIACFRPLSSQEAHSFCTEWGNVHPKGAAGLQDLLYEVTSTPHSFLLIDLSTSPPNPKPQLHTPGPNLRGVGGPQIHGFGWSWCA